MPAGGGVNTDTTQGTPYANYGGMYDIPNSTGGTPSAVGYRGICMGLRATRSRPAGTGTRQLRDEHKSRIRYYRPGSPECI